MSLDVLTCHHSAQTSLQRSSSIIDRSHYHHKSTQLRSMHHQDTSPVP